MKIIGVVYIFMISVFVVACTNDEGKSGEAYIHKVSDSVKMDKIKKYFNDADSAIVEAYVNDSSTISINDIDTTDKTYTTKAKRLYMPGPDKKALAIVFGYKTEGKGMAIVQKVGEKPITLKEGEMNGKVRNYSNGAITLQKSGNFVFLNGVQYEEVK